MLTSKTDKLLTGSVRSHKDCLIADGDDDNKFANDSDNTDMMIMPDDNDVDDCDVHGNDDHDCGKGGKEDDNDVKLGGKE